MTASAAARAAGAGGLLADELFCIAHDDRTGQPHVGPRVLALGLAAALLGELVLFRRVEIGDGGTIRVVDRTPPADALAHATLEHLLAQPQHRHVGTWLAFLAESARDAVTQRLIVAGVWQRVLHRRLGPLGRTKVYLTPIDPNVVAWRAIRLARQVTSPRRAEGALAVPDAVLAGLVMVLGLTDVVLWQPRDRRVGVPRIDAEVARLPWSLRHLLAFTAAAVGDAVLIPR